MNELEKIVQRMIEAGEPEENIATVIKSYNSPGKTSDPVQVESNTGSEDTDSNSVNTSSELPEISSWQSIKNSFSNLFENFSDIGEFYSDDGGKDAAKDITTNAVFSAIYGQENLENKDVWLGGDIGSKNTLEALARYEEDQMEMKQTKGIIDSWKKGDLGGAAAGTVNAITNMIGSVAYGTATFGMGYFADFTARNYAEYNKQKAENLGMSLEELITSGEADNVTPVTLGVASMASESIGTLATVAYGAAQLNPYTRGASKLIPKSILSKVMYSSKARGALGLLASSGTEAVTEITQHGIDAVNDELGRVAGTNEESKAGQVFLEAITSEEGLEAGLQGAIGGGGMVAGTYSVKAMNQVRGAVDGDKLDTDIAEMTQLRVKLNTTKDETVRQGLQNKIDGLEMSIADQVQKGNKIYNSLNGKQISELESFNDLSDVTAFKITELNKKLRTGQITEAEHKVASDGFLVKYDKAKQKIGDMKLAENIEFLESTVKSEKSAKNLETNILNSTLETEAAMENLSEVDKKSKQEFTNNKGEVAGFTVNGKIFVNKEVARKTGQVNVAKHEFLHKVMNAKVGDVAAQSKMVKGIRRAMSSKNRKIVDAEMKNRGYNTKEEFATEYAQVFSDLIAQEKVNFNKSAMGKAGDAIKSFFVGKGFDNISFKDGQGVYNFIKDYSKNTKGLSSEAKAAIGGVDLAQEGGLQKSQTSAEAQKVNDIYNNNENKTEAGFEIAMLYRGMAESVFNSLKEGSNYTLNQKQVFEDKKEDMIAMMLYDKIPSQKANSKARNVVGLVQDFESEKQKYNNVAAYINTFFKERSKEVFTYFAKDAANEGLNREDGTLKKSVSNKTNKVSNVDQGKEARKLTSFDKLKDRKNKDFYSETVKKDVSRDVSMVLIKNIGRVHLTTDKIIENIEENVDKYISRTIKDQMGEISNKEGNLVVSEKYKEFINDSYETAVKSFPLSSIKKSYGKLFKLKQLDREKTAQGNAIFEMTAPTRGEWGAYFTLGKYTTLKAKQLKLAKEIAAEYNKIEVSHLLTDGKFLKKLFEVAEMSGVAIADIQLKQLIKDINVGLDKKAIEGRGFDTTIQFSKTMYDSKQSKAVVDALKTPYAKHVYRTNYIERTNERWLVNAISQVLKASDIKDARKIAEQLGKPWMAKNTFAKEKQKGLDFAIDNLHTKISEGEVTVKVLNAKYGIKSIVDLNSLDGVNSARKAISYISKKLTKSEFIRGIYQGVTNPARVAGFEVSDNVGLEIKKSEAKAIPEFKSNGKRNKAYYSAFKDTKDTNRNLNIESTKDGFRDGNITKKNWYYGNPFNKLDDDGKKAFVKKLYNSSLEDRRILLKLADVLRKGIVDGDLTYQQVQWVLVTQFGNMVGVGKAAAGPKFLMLDKNDNVLTFKNFSDKKNDPGVLEHMIPADYIKGLVYDYVITGNKETLVAELENYATLVLPDLIDKKLREDGTQSAMGIDHKVGSKPTDNRYSGTGLRLYDVSTGKIIDTGLQYSKTEYNKSANIIKAEIQFSKTPKGISVFDFDDTLARTNSKILVKMPDGKNIKIDATEFALKSADLEAAGAEFDFSEFTKVIDGKKGPLADLALKRQGKFGSKNIFVLTARPQEAAYAIHAFLKGIGLNIPIENITGLEDGRPSAKADWITQKAAEGYNDFYFADDAYKNVKAVQDTLNHLNLNPNVEQAKLQFSKKGNSDIFNDILEGTKGVKSEKRFNAAAAKAKGARVKSSWFIPPGAEDFQGLIYQFLAKGKRGELQMKFFELRLFKPFAKANAAMNRAKQAYVDAFNLIKKQYPGVNESLNKKLNKGEYFMQDAVRVYIWNRNGYSIPGMSENEAQSLINFVEKYSDIKAYADSVYNMSKDTNYIKPGENWLDGSVASDISDLTSKENRKRYLGEWINNKNEIFSKENLNKIEAIYGDDFRSALEDILWRMENGTNRTTGNNKLVNTFQNWVNNSVGAIMFFNMRSAVLQTISMVNFINWSDNSPIKAASAVLNFDQYIEDFSTIFNSDMLKQRRSGLQTDVNHAELAKSIRGRGNTPGALLKELLRLGFTPTQLADSFAIASGGATFYRNRIKTYTKQGFTKQQAETKAFEDFAETSEKSQQSSRPDLISQQQAGPLGRLILAFQNTPMQYTRLIKKSILDLYNGRGDAKTHISKIAYYGFVQNLIFTALQNAIFALAFEDDEEDAAILDKKGARMANSMVDTILRGTGVYGAGLSTIKNILLKFKAQEDKGWNADHTYTVIEFMNLSPPIGSKARKLYSGIQTWKFNKEAIADYGPGIGNPIYQAFGNVVAAGTNIPLDRLFNKINNVRASLNRENKAWQRFANFLGWNTWDVGSKADDKLEKLKKKKKRGRKRRSGSSAYEDYKKRKNKN